MRWAQSSLWRPRCEDPFTSCTATMQRVRDTCKTVVVPTLGYGVVLALISCGVVASYTSLVSSDGVLLHNISWVHLQLSDVQGMLEPVRLYCSHRPFVSTVFFSLVFLFKTMTCLPGALLLVALAGAVWPYIHAFSLCLSLVVVGSMISFFYSKFALGRSAASAPPVLSLIFGVRSIEQLQRHVQAVSFVACPQMLRAIAVT